MSVDGEQWNCYGWAEEADIGERNWVDCRIYGSETTIY